MIREVFKNPSWDNKEFNHRGSEPGRLENFSDACFALAITLLLISTSPPTTFLQVKRFVFDLIPFTFCIVLIVSIWYQHFIFYYRYGLRNATMVMYNTVFLIIILFFVYPLKFLTKFALYPIALLFDVDWLLADLRSLMVGLDMSFLMAIYGFGAAATSITLMMMYRYALKKKDQLQLSEIEQFDTRSSIVMNLSVGAIPFLSAFSALFLEGMWAGIISGSIYYLYIPLMPWIAVRREKRRKRLLARLSPTSDLIESQVQPAEIKSPV